MDLTEESEQKVEAVLFDFGLVLSGPPEAVAWARMRAVSGLDEEPLHTAYWAFRHDYDRGALAGVPYWHEVARHAGTVFDTAQVAELIEADVDLWTDMNLPMVAWVHKLQKAGVRTGILSNIGDAIAEGICAKLPWLTQFYHCTWSHSLFMAKPEAAIYLKTAEALHTPPGKILFIDDREVNIAAAIEVGMQAIQYTGQAQFEREMRQRGLGWLLDVDQSTGSEAELVERG